MQESVSLKFPNLQMILLFFVNILLKIKSLTANFINENDIKMI